MDLGAYANIDELDKIAVKNGIEIPRLRGYRLMKDEETVTKQDIEEILHSYYAWDVECLCRSVPFWDPNSSCNEYSYKADRLCEYYVTEDRDIRWDRIHGWKRKILKFELKKRKRKVLAQYETFNKYVGREDVLYIHSRIGGNNWSYFGGPEKVASQSWFLEKVDDSFDSTYCDIYAKIMREHSDVMEE